MRSGYLALAAILFLASTITGEAAAPPQAVAVQVPFVGCKSDGQVGPLGAPAGRIATLDISPALARRLAFYKARGGWGVLAPRGWYCFGTYGSAGANLYVTPVPIETAKVLAYQWKGFSGQVIRVSYEYGGTSGRFGVADVIARVFPAYMVFVHDVIAENDSVGGASLSFHFGPYPHDKLKYVNNHTVEYETPANANGLGTFYQVQPNSEPIFGVAALVGHSPDLVFVAMRVPENDRDLRRPILEQVEHRTGEMPPR
jgi:hypothetical protein